MTPETLSNPELKERILQWANRLSNGAYSGHPVDRITIEDIYDIASDPEFWHLLHGCNPEGVVEDLRAWNLERINQERRMGQIMHGMNPDEIGNALKQLAELHTRPQSVQIEEEVGELPF